MPENQMPAATEKQSAPEEPSAFTSFYHRHGAVRTAVAFGLSITAVRDTVEKLNIKTEREAGEWTKEEIAVLRRDYPTKGSHGIAVALGRSCLSVRTKAMKLGISYNGRRPWSASDIAYLREHYPTEGSHKVAEALGRSPTAVSDYAATHSIKWQNPAHWTEAQKQAVRADYHELGVTACALKYGRTASSLRSFMHHERSRRGA